MAGGSGSHKPGSEPNGAWQATGLKSLTTSARKWLFLCVLHVGLCMKYCPHENYNLRLVIYSFVCLSALFLIVWERKERRRLRSSSDPALPSLGARNRWLVLRKELTIQNKFTIEMLNIGSRFICLLLVQTEISWQLLARLPSHYVHTHPLPPPPPPRWTVITLMTFHPHFSSSNSKTHAKQMTDSPRQPPLYFAFSAN